MIVLRGQVPKRLISQFATSVATTSELPGPFTLIRNASDSADSFSLIHQPSGLTLTNELLIPVTLRREQESIPPVDKVVITRYQPNKSVYGLEVYLKEK